MNLKEKLNGYFFNLETAQLLQTFGRTSEQISGEMQNLNFSSSLLQFPTSSRHLYDSVMLRLRLYSENNNSEEQVRQSFSVLNNSYVNSLLDYLYLSGTSEPVAQTVQTTQPVQTSQPVAQPVAQPVVQPVQTSQPVAQPVVQTVQTSQTVAQTVQTSQTVAQTVQSEDKNEVEDSELEESEVESENEENSFESFYKKCVKQTEEPMDIVKLSDFYQSFTEWWSGEYEETVPDKKELKNYLNEKLGKSKKSTWTNVTLSN